MGHTTVSQHYNSSTGQWEAAKHPRGLGGKFAHVPGGGSPLPDNAPAWLHAIKGKVAPSSFKFYKPGYKPKPITPGNNAAKDGFKLWQLKKDGAFSNDYEFWLAAGKIAAEHKKKHGNKSAATPHNIVNAAFNHELNITGGLNIGGSKPTVVQKHVHGKTSSGVNVVSKHAPPGTLTKFKKTMPGATGAQVWDDDKGQEWLVKGNKPGSNAYGVKFAVLLEDSLAKIQNKAGLRSATSHKTTVDGKEVLAQKMFGDVHTAFPNGPNISTMSDEQKLEMQKQQILDWVISNFDTHTGNFLEDKHGIIGIDKGQAFKFFGKDKLDWNYVPVTPLGGDKLTYSTMWKDYVAGKGDMFDFDTSPELLTFAQRLKNIDDDEYTGLLRPYAEEAEKQGILANPSNLVSGKNMIQEFLDLAVERKNNVVKDFSDFFAKAEQAKDGGDKPQGPITKLGPSHQTNSKVQVGVKGVLEDIDGNEHKVHIVDVIAGDEVQFKTVGFNSDEPQIAKFVNGEWKAGGPDDLLTDFINSPDVINFDFSSAPTTSGLQDGDDVPWGKVQVGMNVVYGAHDLTIGEPILNQLDTPVAYKTTKWGGVAGPNLHKLYFNEGSVGFVDEGASLTAKKDAQLAAPPGSTANKIKTNVPIALQHLAFVEDKLAPGYNITKDSDGYHITKPGGEPSKSSGGQIKTWPTDQAALDSSTMAKYHTQVKQQAQAGLSGAVAEATNAPTITPGNELDLTNSSKYNNLKAKIIAGEHTPDEYLEFKTLKNLITNQKKAAGAAQIEDEFDNGTVGFEPPADPPKKSGFKEQPKFKLKGGAPPALESAKGPKVQDYGKQLWEAKKAGNITDDYKMWSEAKKLAGKDKKQALLKNPNAKVGEDYSSANAIRAVAMRLEYDETGDVVWESTESKTSQQVGDTVAGIKKQNALHSHVPVVDNPNQHKSAWSDAAAKPGSYANPHSFKYGDTAALRKYGYKYTSHSNWDPDQKSAWYGFSGSGYSSTNTYFRTGDVGAYGNVGHAKKQAQNLVKAFESTNIKPFDDWTIVTRGTNGGWEFGIGSDQVSIDDVKAMKGKVVRNKCPVSSSLRTNSAFSGQFKITYKLPPGFKGLSILGHSAHASEDEVILPPGMAYRVLDVKDTGEVLVEVVDVKLPDAESL